MGTHPMNLVIAAFERAAHDAPFDHTAAALATASRAGVPSARFVLVKALSEQGAVFYTNERSRKGVELSDNPYAALTFYWPWTKEQVRLEGAVVRVDEATAQAYFASRPRESQAGAWASQQSQPLASRDVFLARVQDVEAQYQGVDIPKPPHWGGYCLSPSRVELWKEVAGRLHERTLFTCTNAQWSQSLLFP